MISRLLLILSILRFGFAIVNTPTGTTTIDIPLSNLNGVNGYTVIGTSHIGLEVECCDFTGDGFTDCAYKDENNLYVIFGKSVTPASRPSINVQQLDGTNGFIISIPNEVKIASGNINGDNFCDLVIGVRSENKVYVVFGTISFPSMTTLASISSVTFDGTAFTNSSFGENLAVGDVNKDGLSEILITAPNFNNTGAVFVIYGRNNTELAQSTNMNNYNGSVASGGIRIDGQNPFPFARGVKTGDTNGDQTSDILITGGSLSDQSIYIIYGQNNDYFPPIANVEQLDARGLKYIAPSGTNEPCFAIGNLDGGGNALVAFTDLDVIAYISFPPIEDGFLNSGRIFGETSDPFTKDIIVEDIDSDGYADIIMSTRNNTIYYFPGYSSFSAPGIFDLQNAAYTIYAPGPAGSRNVITTADVNGDKKLDLIIGYADLTIGQNQGAAYVLFGPIKNIAISPPPKNSGAIVYTSILGTYELRGDSVEKALTSKCPDSASPVSTCDDEILILKPDMGELLGFFDFDTRNLADLSKRGFTIILGAQNLSPNLAYDFSFFNNGTIGNPVVSVRASDLVQNEFKTFRFALPSDQKYFTNGVVRIQVATPSNTTRSQDNQDLTIDYFTLDYDASAIEDGSEKKKKTLTAGEKAAIAICVIIGVLGIAAAVVVFIIFRRKRKERSENAKSEEVELNVPEMDKDGLLLIKEVNIGKKIGNGAFGDVFKGTWRGTDVAIKQIKDSFSTEFVKEAKLLQKLVHPNTVQFLGLYVDGENRYLVTEFCEGGSLLDQLKRNEKDKFNNRQLLEFAHEAAKGMAFLEGEKIIHRDLAARNLLVHKNVVKVADFGLSKDVGAEVYESKTQGQLPVRWSSPESIMNHRFSSKSDSWSMGITLWEIFTRGELPYEDMNNGQVIRAVCENGYRLGSIVENTKCPEAIWELMTECWKQDPQERPTLAEISKRIENIKNSYVEVKAETKTSESQPIETQPVETKPAKSDITPYENRDQSENEFGTYSQV